MKISTNTQHNYFILDKGSADGVTSGSGVITPNGAIGIIDAVSENYSYAISFQNHNIQACPGCIQRCAVTAGTAADDYHIVNMCHRDPSLRLKCLRQEFFDSGFGFRGHNGAQGLAVFVEHQRGNHFDMLKICQQRLLVDIDLHHFQMICILCGHLVVCGADAAAIAAAFFLSKPLDGKGQSRYDM